MPTHCCSVVATTAAIVAAIVAIVVAVVVVWLWLLLLLWLSLLLLLLLLLILLSLLLQVHSGAASVAFCVSRVAVADIMRVADAGQLMPPKATCFNPKPLSGLLTRLC